MVNSVLTLNASQISQASVQRTKSSDCGGCGSCDTCKAGSAASSKGKNQPAYVLELSGKQEAAKPAMPQTYGANALIQ